jgi:hypothetical protein
VQQDVECKACSSRINVDRKDTTIIVVQCVIQSRVEVCKHARHKHSDDERYTYPGIVDLILEALDTIGEVTRVYSVRMRIVNENKNQLIAVQ